MTGQYAHNIDAKGRLFIPARLREELGQTFHVTVGQDHCLSVYSDESWAAFMDKLKALAKIYGVSLDWLCSDASDAGALVQEKNLDERDPVCNSELPTEDKPKKRKKWAIIIGVIIVGVLLSAYVVLSKKAGSFLSTAKQIDDLEEENVENAPESGFEFDWQGE